MENFIYLHHTCTCDNQHLLEHGKTCSICMGQIRNTENVLEAVLPTTSFDEDYFEALEAYHYASEQSIAA